MEEIAPGLWRWAAPHPAWAPGAEPDSPDDWGHYVGSVFYEDRDAVVFIDPLLPGDQDQFWRWADERVSGRSAVVLTTLIPHRRSREQVGDIQPTGDWFAQSISPQPGRHRRGS